MDFDHLGVRLIIDGRASRARRPRATHGRPSDRFTNRERATRAAVHLSESRATHHFAQRLAQANTYGRPLSSSALLSSLSMACRPWPDVLDDVSGQVLHQHFDRRAMCMLFDMFPDLIHDISVLR